MIAEKIYVEHTNANTHTNKSYDIPSTLWLFPSVEKKKETNNQAKKHQKKEKERNIDINKNKLALE